MSMSSMRAHSVGITRESAQLLPPPSSNHAKTASIDKIASAAAKRGFRRVAGNVFICDSTKEFWNVRGNKLIRVTKQEVDNGERIALPRTDAPAGFMDELLDGISF